MKFWQRHRIGRGALLLGAAAVVSSWLAVGFYFEERGALIAQRDGKFQAVTDGISILQRQNELRQLTARMEKSVTSDSSAAEGQLLHIVHDWETRAGTSGASFQRIGTSQQNGFVLLTFDVSASGNMGALAGFLYEVETAAIPLRIEDVQIRSRTADDQNLQMHLQISTLYRGNTRQISRPGEQDANQVAREPQATGVPG